MMSFIDDLINKAPSEEYKQFLRTNCVEKWDPLFKTCSNEGKESVRWLEFLLQFCGNDENEKKLIDVNESDSGGNTVLLNLAKSWSKSKNKFTLQKAELLAETGQVEVFKENKNYETAYDVATDLMKQVVIKAGVVNRFSEGDKKNCDLLNAKRGNKMETVEVHKFTDDFNDKYYNFVTKPIKREIEKDQADLEIGKLKGLQKLNHENVLKMYHAVWWSQKRRIVLIMEHFEGATRIQDLFIPKCTASNCEVITQQIFCALKYLHGRNPVAIIHRNLSPKTVLVSKTTWQVKLIGLEKSKIVTDRKHDHHTKQDGKNDYCNYMAPETTENLTADADDMDPAKTVYTTAADIYSAGIILFELYNGELFECKKYKEMLAKQKDSFEKKVYESCIINEREKRKSAVEILKMDYYARDDKRRF